MKPVVLPITRIAKAARLTRPSGLYRAKLWRLGQLLARHAPHGLLGWLACRCAALYFRARPVRREMVVQNLLPALGGDREKARTAAGALFEQFAIKLTDLLRFESGRSIRHLFHDLRGWDHFSSAQSRGRGVLLLTVHLGNWEFGGSVLIERGVKLKVITMAEPQPGLTALRRAARARWGIETLALGNDPFASVEIIRRLQANECVALLMDRPPAAKAAVVNLFGRPFPASISAAELARASGCALLPVLVPRTAEGYVGHILPEIPYDRQALGDRSARVRLTQEIIHVFAPAIGQYIDQWYHFVPVWQIPPPTATQPSAGPAG